MRCRACDDLLKDTAIDPLFELCDKCYGESKKYFDDDEDDIRFEGDSNE